MNEGYIDMIPITSFQKISRLVGFISLLITLFVLGPILTCAQEFQEEQKFVRTTQARLEVERAWDVYHDGALGGTLQSPKVQTELEMYLHRSRELLAEAYDAEDKGDFIRASQLIKNIMQITNRVIIESQVEKK
jgi:hypothetical protein